MWLYEDWQKMLSKKSYAPTKIQKRKKQNSNQYATILVYKLIYVCTWVLIQCNRKVISIAGVFLFPLVCPKRTQPWQWFSLLVGSNRTYFSQWESVLLSRDLTWFSCVFLTGSVVMRFGSVPPGGSDVCGRLTGDFLTFGPPAVEIQLLFQFWIIYK